MKKKRTIYLISIVSFIYIVCLSLISCGNDDKERADAFESLNNKLKERIYDQDREIKDLKGLLGKCYGR